MLQNSQASMKTVAPVVHSSMKMQLLCSEAGCLETGKGASASAGEGDMMTIVTCPMLLWKSTANKSIA